MIKIKNSKNASNATSEPNISRKKLLKATFSHQSDVMQGCKFIADKIIESGQKHDMTKITHIDEFYNDFISLPEEGDFKSGVWWEIHQTKERHHLQDRVPEDVNLIDVIECIVDGCMAGMARNGGCYEIELDPEVLKKAVHNTQQLILSQIVVEGEA